MVADSITDSQLFHGSPISRDFVKKRKANWFSKLKQWKIDARRRQWIYQWKKANAGEEENGCSRLRALRDKPIDIKTASPRCSYLQAWSVDHHELGSYGGFAKCDDDSDDDETNLSASTPTSVLKNKDSYSYKSGDDCFCCSKQITEEDEEPFDDADESGEVFSDALSSFDNEGNLNPLQHEEAPIPNPNTSASQRNKSSPAKLIHKDKCKQKPSPAKAIHHRVSREKNEDMCKKQTSEAKAVHHKVSSKKKEKSDQKKEGDDEINPCPICSEEMDATDLSFLPCPCGFRLCLFCYKQINEGNGHCPSCRKEYDKTTSNSGEISFQQRGRGPLRLSPSFKGLDIA